jgi:ClpP class serine protease
MPWLLKKETADELMALRKELLPHAAAANPRAAYAEARESGKVKAGPDAVMSVDIGVANISVEGVLTREPDACAWYFGIKNTAYSHIIAALSEAESNPAVKSVVMHVDSPGGNVDGLFDTLAAIQAFTKPMSVRANQACSAAFAIAAAAGRITATNPAATFGSVGVAVSIRVDPDVLDLTSTDAPEKRPDVNTEEGRAVYIRLLDAIHDLFAGAIADGRGIDKAEVNEKFGRGATLLANEALSRGMIDAVIEPPRRVRSTSRAAASDETVNDAAASGEEKKMDLQAFKSQHPDLFAAAVAEGVAQERDRVVAHLTMGEPAGEAGLKIAVDAIKAGEGHSLTANARYMAVALNQRDKQLRQEESNEAGQAADGAAASANEGEKDLGDQVAAIMAEKRGKTNG